MPSSVPKRILDVLLGLGVDVSRVDAGLLRKIARDLDALQKGLIKTIYGSGLDTNRLDWQQARLRNMLHEANEQIAETYSVISRDMSVNLYGLVELNSHAIVQGFNKAIGANLFRYDLTDSVLARLVDNALIEGASSAEWWSRQSKAFTQYFSDSMRMGLARGETITELRNRVLPMTDLRTVPDRAQRDIIKTARRNAEALVRTSTLTVMRESTLDVYSENSDLIVGVQWCSTLDTRTTPICRAMDGLKWKLPDYEPIGHDKEFPGPSPHWNCRSVVLPVLKSFEQMAREAGGDTELAKKLDQIPEGQRASMDGPVPAGTTYESWFAEQSEARQREILGKGRYELYEQGKVSLRDMVDGAGSPLRLDELREKYDFWVDPKRFEEWYHNPVGNFVIHNLPEHIKKLLNTEAESLRFSKASLLKQKDKHSEISADDYVKLLNNIGGCKEIYPNRDLHVALVIENERPYMIILKTTQDRKEAYLVSVYIARDNYLKLIRQGNRIY